MECVYKKTGILFKLLPCLLILMIAFMTLYGSFVYATTDTVVATDINNNSVNVVLPQINFDLDAYEYYFFHIHDWNGKFFCALFATNDRVYYNNRKICFTGTYYQYNSAVTNTDYDFSSLEFPTLNTGNSSYPYADLSSSYNVNYIFTNQDILNSNDDVVFQAPPQQVEGVQGIVATQIQPVEMNKTLQEIIAILPIVLVVIVGLIALRKAIQFLMRIMRKA